MKKFFTFNGRIDRTSYFGYCLLVSSLAYAFKLLITHTDSIFNNLISIFSGIIAYIFCICITVQRLHDINRSGWQWILLKLPIYNIYLAFLLFFKKGTEGPNKYGVNPLDRKI